MEKLLNSDVDIEYKKRAIAVLLSPDTSSVQFYWNGDINEKKPSLCDIPTVRGLRDYYISTLYHFLRYVRTKKDEKYRKWEDRYNYGIIRIMTIKDLSHNVKEELLDVFYPADAEEWSDPFDICGYGPFSRFMCADKISDSYKTIVDAKMRDLIMKMAPKEKERAMWWYAMLVWARLPECSEYGYDIFIAQVKFLVDSQYILSHDNLSIEYQVPILYDLLEKNEKHANIRCMFSVNVASCFLKTTRLNWFMLKDQTLSKRIISDLESIGEHDLISQVQARISSFEEEKAEKKRKSKALKIKAKKEEKKVNRIFSERLLVL